MADREMETRMMMAKQAQALNMARVAGTQEGGMAYALNPTLRENIETKIQIHKEEIARLEKIMAQFEGTPIIDMNLRDLREAMQF